MSAADLLLNQPNLTDAAYYTDYVGEQERHQLPFLLLQVAQVLLPTNGHRAQVLPLAPWPLVLTPLLLPERILTYIH